LSAHPETATGRQAIWLQGFKRKFLFMVLDIPSVSNTGGLRVFRCAAGKVNATAGNQESVTLQAITPRFALNLIASHKK
jgi:hypothetical protein